MDLSVVIPAYNEARRLPRFLDSIRAYGDQAWGAYEVIVVDDGSTDETATLVGHVWNVPHDAARFKRAPQCRLIRHDANQGKGTAVRTGMLAARGGRLLFADADGATPIEEEAKLRQALDDGAEVAVGSRWPPHPQPLSPTGARGGLPTWVRTPILTDCHKPKSPLTACAAPNSCWTESEFYPTYRTDGDKPSRTESEYYPTNVERTRCRQWAGWLFAWAARNALGLKVRDTQCGFKMFTRAAGLRLFQLCRENGYLFDLEILFWAQWSGYRVTEVPITWREVAGSKLRLLRDGWRMAAGLWRLRRSLWQRATEMGRSLKAAPTKDVGGDTRFDQAMASVAAHRRHRPGGTRAALLAAGPADSHLG
ncbi:MAG: glycosyltransferase family 2 protein [Gemmataceae bacterium]|nr:glycosyltransferase family 2 protein [Gemmataceae bacterium]